MTENQVRKQTIGINIKVIQILVLAEGDFKITMINTVKKLEKKVRQKKVSWRFSSEKKSNGNSIGENLYPEKFWKITLRQD